MSDIVERIEEAFRHDTFWDTDAPPLLSDAVAEIKRLRRDRQWIAVSQMRLPEPGDCVWGFDGNETFLCEYWRGSLFQTYGASADAEGLNSETLVGVTHWAPLICPEPPETT
jgi:hypothetical protein